MKTFFNFEYRLNNGDPFVVSNSKTPFELTQKANRWMSENGLEELYWKKDDNSENIIVNIGLLPRNNEVLLKCLETLDKEAIPKGISVRIIKVRDNKYILKRDENGCDELYILEKTQVSEGFSVSNYESKPYIVNDKPRRKPKGGLIIPRRPRPKIRK